MEKGEILEKINELGEKWYELGRNVTRREYDGLRNDIAKNIKADSKLMNDLDIGKKLMQENDSLLCECMSEDVQLNIITEKAKSHRYLPTWTKMAKPELLEQVKPYITYQIEGMKMSKSDNRDDYIVYCTQGDKKFEFELYCEIADIMDDGYHSSYAGMKVPEVEKFGEMTHVIKEPQTFEFFYDNGGFECPVFGVSYDLSPYEEMSSAWVNLEYFKENEKLQESKKENLISEIIEAQNEGKELDAEIEKTKEGDKGEK